jgi:hypothetical protein
MHDPGAKKARRALDARRAFYRRVPFVTPKGDEKT